MTILKSKITMLDALPACGQIDRFKLEPVLSDATLRLSSLAEHLRRTAQRDPYAVGWKDLSSTREAKENAQRLTDSIRAQQHLVEAIRACKFPRKFDGRFMEDFDDDPAQLAEALRDSTESLPGYLKAFQDSNKSGFGVAMIERSRDLFEHACPKHEIRVYFAWKNPMYGDVNYHVCDGTKLNLHEGTWDYDLGALYKRHPAWEAASHDAEERIEDAEKEAARLGTKAAERKLEAARAAHAKIFNAFTNKHFPKSRYIAAAKASKVKIETFDAK